MKFSIIVSDSISQNSLPACITILCTQDYPADDYEVLLPDLGLLSKEDAHVLGTFEQEYPHFRILRGEPGIEHRARRLDAAIREARGENILFLESHCLAPRGWLRMYSELVDAESPALALGRFKTIPTTSRVGNAEETWRTRCMQGYERLGLMTHYFDFHNALIRKDLYERLGGLEPELPMMAEFDFGVRAVMAGERITPFTKSCVAHINDSGLSSYAGIIEGQGADRTRILFLRGADVIARYYPNPRFLSMLSVLRFLRVPFLAGLTVRKWMYAGLFRALLAVGLDGLAQRAFEAFAADSHRRGQVIGLKGVDRLKKAPAREAAPAVAAAK